MYNIGHWWKDNLPGVGTKFDYTGYPSNLDWSWGPTSPDFPPVSQSLAEDTVALVPADARAANSASRAFGTRPTIENSVDLITGRPLVKETDLELAFGGATFRYIRTFSKMNDHEGVLRRDGANPSNFAFLPVGRQEFCWDWHGEGWMSNLSPILLIDAAYHEILGQGDNSTASNHTPPRRRTWFVLDAHRSIPFDRDPATGNYTCPAQFDAKLIPIGGTWTTDTTPEGGHWQIFPTQYKVILRDSLTYTVEVQPDELPYMSCPDEAGNLVLASAAPDLNRPGQPARVGMGGRGAPRHGFTTQIDDNYGHRVQITLAPRREWIVNDPDQLGDPRPVVVDNHHEWGQVRAVKLIRNAGPQETVEWTLLFQYRAFWGDASWRLGALQDPPRFGAMETWNLERNGQPTVNGEFAALFKPTAVHRIYVYRGFDTTLANFISQQPEWDWLDGSPDGWTLQGKKFTRATPQRLELSEADAIESAYPAGWAHKVSYLYQDMESMRGGSTDYIPDVHGLGERSAADGLVEESPTGDEHKPLLRKSEVATRSSSQPTDLSSQRRLYFYRIMAEVVISPSGTVDLGYILDEEGVGNVIREMESARAENLDTDLDNGTVKVAWPSPVGGGAPVTVYEGGSQPFTTYTVLRSDFKLNQPYAYRDSTGALKQKYIFDHATISLLSNRAQYLDNLGGIPGVAGMVQSHLGLSPSQLARTVFDRESVLRGAVLRRRNGSADEAFYRTYSFMIVPDGVNVPTLPSGLEGNPYPITVGYGLLGDWTNSQIWPQRSIYHYPYKWIAFEDALNAYGQSTWGDVPIDQLRSITAVNLNEPRWVTVVDKFSDLPSGAGRPTGDPNYWDDLAGSSASGKWAERRVVHINAAGYILSDRRWGMTADSAGALTHDAGLGEFCLYDTKNRIIERRSAGWSALPVEPPSERQTKGLIYAFQYTDTATVDATKPSQIGVKWGTGGTVQPISDITYHDESPEIAHTEIARPTTNPVDAVLTETLLDAVAVPDSPTNANRIAARLLLKPAVAVAPGSSLYRTIDGEGFLPDGRLRWKARGQINTIGAARIDGDSVALDIMVYADDLPPGTLPATAPSTSLCASIEDAEEGASVALPGLGVSFTIPAIAGDFAWLSRYASTVAGASGPPPAANRATSYIYGDFGLSRVFYPDGRRQYVFADVGSNEIEQRLYDDVVVGGGSSSFQTLKSGRIIRTTMSGKLLETKTVDWIATGAEPTGSESYTTVFTQTASADDNGRLTALARTTAGTTDTLAASVVFGIGSQVERSASPEGLLTRNLYDPRGRLSRVFAGTADLDDYWTSGVPSSSSTGDDMVMTERRKYGTGMTDALELIETRSYRIRHASQFLDDAEFAAGNDGASLTEQRKYDRAMRLAKTRVLSETQALIRETVTYYDDLDREVITAVYSHPGVPSSLDPSGLTGAFYGANPADTIAAILANTKLPLALEQVVYNARGNVEERRRYSPAANQTAKYLSTRSYYDHADRRVLEERPGGGTTRTWYDSEGNVSRSSLYAGAREVRRTVDQRDQFKNVISTSTLERRHDAAATPTELDATNSVATYVFSWFDQAGKVIASAELGTADAGNQFKNAATAPVRPATPPTWDAVASAYTGPLGATALISLTEYDAQGKPVAVRSPKGSLTRSFFSNLGHVILQVENADGAPSLVRRTAYKFDKGRLIAVAAVLPGHVVQPDGQIDWTPAATLQITSVEYGADVVAYSTSTPGAVLYVDPARVARVRFPSIPGGTGAPDLTFKYYPDGQLARRTDRRGLEFTYFYDGRGNRTAAIVSNRQEYDPFQSGLVDVSEEVQLGYDALDRLIGVSSAATSSLFFESKSDVAFDYDALGNLTADHQFHGDKLVVGSASVTYGWDFSPAASGNRVRLSSMTYPHWSSAPATALAFGYGSAGSESDKLDRLSSISIGSNQLASYSYTGAGRRVGTTMDQGAMTQSSGSSGVYGSLDRYGRTTDITWKRAGTTQQAYGYGYDAAGNALFERWDHMYAGVLNQNKLSQKFAYDALNRMISAERGQLDAANTAIIHSATAPTARLVEWGLDNLDNLTGNAVSPFGVKTSWFNVATSQQVTTGSMTHTVDAQNQVNGIAAAGNYATGVGTISGSTVYDRAGNMVADTQYFYQYDAWNRLVQVSDLGSATFDADGVIASGIPGSWRIHYTYDGLGRQIRKQQPWTEGNGDKFVRSAHYFYDGVRRIQEVVVDPLSSAAPVELKDDKCEPPPAEEDSLTLTLDREYVYGPGDRLGVDEFVCQIDSVGNFIYMLQNASGDVTALVRDGEVICQYTFDPNGVLINADHIEAQVVNRVGHKGLFFDRIDGHPMGRQLLANARGIYQNRNRVYHPMLGRFMQKDPNESGLPVIANGAMMAANPAMASLLPFDAQGMYGDGMNLYGYLGGNPYARRDPLGLSWDPFSMTDDYLAEAAGAQAAFLERVIRGFDTASHIAWQLAQLHPAIGLAASAYKLASGEGDLWDVLAVAGPAGKLIGKAMGAAKKAAGYYISKFGTCKICVAEGTLVQTPLGPVPVECIQPGDLVLSLAEDDPLGLPRFMPVTAVYHNEGSELLAVTFIDGGTLRLTAAHEVYTTEKGWGLAEDLRPGQRMLGESTSVREIAKVDRSYGAVPTYNLTVEGSHTFYADGAWVHNCAKARAQWKRWQLTDAASDAVKVHGKFGKIYKRGDTWWSKDLAGHGGSAFKVFEETPTGLRWIHDADDFGNYIVGKHKGPIGAFIPWSELR